MPHFPSAAFPFRQNGRFSESSSLATPVREEDVAAVVDLVEREKVESSPGRRRRHSIRWVQWKRSIRCVRECAVSARLGTPESLWLRLIQIPVVVVIAVVDPKEQMVRFFPPSSKILFPSSLKADLGPNIARQGRRSSDFSPIKTHESNHKKRAPAFWRLFCCCSLLPFFRHGDIWTYCPLPDCVPYSQQLRFARYFSFCDYSGLQRPKGDALRP